MHLEKTVPHRISEDWYDFSKRGRDSIFFQRNNKWPRALASDVPRQFADLFRRWKKGRNGRALFSQSAPRNAPRRTGISNIGERVYGKKGCSSSRGGGGGGWEFCPSQGVPVGQRGSKFDRRTPSSEAKWHVLCFSSASFYFSSLLPACVFYSPPRSSSDVIDLARRFLTICPPAC